MLVSDGTCVLNFSRLFGLAVHAISNELDGPFVFVYRHLHDVLANLVEGLTHLDRIGPAALVLGELFVQGFKDLPALGVVGIARLTAALSQGKMPSCFVYSAEPVHTMSSCAIRSSSDGFTTSLWMQTWPIAAFAPFGLED